MNLAKCRLKMIREQFCSGSGCEYGSEQEYRSEEEVDSEEEYRGRPLTDDSIYADNGYDADFELPDGVGEYQRFMDDERYNQYESLKRQKKLPAKRK